MKAFGAAVTIVSALFALGAGSGQAAELRERAIFPKPVATEIDPDHHSTHEVVVKFHEGTHIRLREERLVFDPDARSDEERERMKRPGLTEERVLSDVDRANELLFEHANGTVGSVFARSGDEPESERSELEQIAAEELADLGLYFKLVFDEPDRALAEKTIDALNALRSVEISYAEPLPAEPATDIAPTTTINLVPSQGYLRPAFQGGIDADWAGRLPGGRGAGIRVEDVESGWDKDHEDLPGTYFAENGWNFADGSHGAAVLGVLAAGDNAYGATGIVPDVTLGLSSPVWADAWSPHSTAAAVDNAAAALRRGDILVIEQHYPEATPPGAMCTANCSQFGYLPAESVQAVYDAVRRATAKGIVVVEAAGNGSMNLDDPFYNNRFNGSIRDSGAIIVGAGFEAGTTSPLTAKAWTNFGSRVDLQGWGDSVATLGYGDNGTLQANGGDARQWYTRFFSGTSSATPIVAGAAAAVNGWRLADGEPLYDSIAMRQWLVSTGTAQTGTKQIGPLPDLRRAMPAVAGRLDEVRADGVARGWAFHSAQAATSVGVHFYVDGPAGTGAWGGSATANVSRPDVNTYFNITGSHGFEHRIPDAFRDDANHTLYAYGIDPTGQRNRELEQRLVFNLPNVNGAIDSIDANGRVQGWAYAAQSPSQSITVHLYADGPRNGGGTWVGSYVANASRPDVNAAFGISGSHGFDLQLSSQFGDGKQHVLYAYGIDPRGINNPLLGTKGFSWLDSDLDGFGDNVDNCPSNHNPSQSDFDNDGLGDPCDNDDDGDGALENVWPFDNCVRLYNPDQKDTDGDGYGDACDLTPNGPDQDGDGDPDATDPDDDGDGVLDAKDNCQYVKNAAQTDIDGDGVGTACDPDEFIKAGAKTMGALKVRQEYFAKFERFEVPVFPCLKPSCGPLVLTIDVHLDIDLPMRIVDAEGRVLVEAETGLDKVLKLEIDSPIEGNEPEHSQPRYFLEILRSPELEADREYPISIEAGSEEHPGGG